MHYNHLDQNDLKGLCKKKKNIMCYYCYDHGQGFRNKVEARPSNFSSTIELCKILVGT